MRRLFLTFGLVAAGAFAVFAGPTSPGVVPQATGTAVIAEGNGTSVVLNGDGVPVSAKGHGTSVMDVVGKPTSNILAAPQDGWPVPSKRSYYLESSCQQYASTIARGAAAWEGMTEGSGTPVECRNSYIDDCGVGGRIVGCNWGQGQRIALYMGGVSDGALLAAHEFGHDWYGHSSYQCAGWSSPEEVMAPTMCSPTSESVNLGTAK